MSFIDELKTSLSGGPLMVELNTSYIGWFVGCGDHASAESAAAAAKCIVHSSHLTP